jgi:sulfhydrogenase subunit beta (sulfur reductase)
MEFTIRKEKIPQLLRGLLSSYRVYGPVRKGEQVLFARIEDGTDLDLAYQNSLLSPKGLFLPQSEKMFECSLDPARDDRNIFKEIPKDDTPRVIVGIRPCDARALTLVDVNFDTTTYRDPWWIKAREITTLVGLGCDAPCSTCFCTAVGGGPFDETGLDVLLIDGGDAFVAKAVTEKGRKLLESTQALETAAPEIMEKARAVAEQATARIITSVDMSVDTSGLAKMENAALYEAGFWEDVQFACINCGTCTFLCPTCWCFDIQDETFAKNAVRMRNWDSCMFPLFTLHASGHNPRGKKVQRVRQRFMHKLKYYVDKYGRGVACVGCGRCVQHCPVNIDIRRVVQLMNETAS